MSEAGKHSEVLKAQMQVCVLNAFCRHRCRCEPPDSLILKRFNPTASELRTTLRLAWLPGITCTAVTVLGAATCASSILQLHRSTTVSGSELLNLCVDAGACAELCGPRTRIAAFLFVVFAIAASNLRSVVSPQSAAEALHSWIRRCAGAWLKSGRRRSGVL